MALAAPARADRIRTVDGDLEEDVVGVEGRGDALALRTARRTIPAALVKEVAFGAGEREARPAPARAFLVTGEELAGEIVGGDEDEIQLRCGSLGVTTVGLDLLRAVAFLGDEAEMRRFRREALPLEAKQDVLLTRAWARQEGALEKIDAEGVSFTTEDLGTVVLPYERLVGARIRPIGKPPAPSPGLRARLDLADGSAVVGTLEGMKQGALVVDCAWRRALEVRTSEVRALSFLGGKVAYLSDLTPVEVEERAKLVSIVFKHRADASVMGNALKLDGRTYRKGLGVHAYTRLAFALDGAYARFRAVIGLDDEAKDERRALGTVRFQVLVDGKPALGAEGLTLTTEDAARPIDIDVYGAERLTLVADFGKSEDTLARGAWADAYLVKK
jgi:hypothetical protein